MTGWAFTSGCAGVDSGMEGGSSSKPVVHPLIPLPFKASTMYRYLLQRSGTGREEEIMVFLQMSDSLEL